MKYDHMVKANGVYYASGEDVPEGNAEMAAEETSLPFSDSDITFEGHPEEIYTDSLSPDDGDNAKYYDEQSEKQYTKTDIMKMNKAQLQELASEMEIEGAYEKSGEDLKKNLLNLLGL